MAERFLYASESGSSFEGLETFIKKVDQKSIILKKMKIYASESGSSLEGLETIIKRLGQLTQGERQLSYQKIFIVRLFLIDFDVNQTHSTELPEIISSMIESP